MLSKGVRLAAGQRLVGHCVRLVSLLFLFVSLLVFLLVGHCVRLVSLLSPSVSGLVSLLVGHCVRLVALLFPCVFIFVSLLVGHSPSVFLSLLAYLLSCWSLCPLCFPSVSLFSFLCPFVSFFPHISVWGSSFLAAIPPDSARPPVPPSVPRSFPPSTHSLTHSLTPSLTHSLTHSLAHSLTHSLTHALTHSLTAHSHSQQSPEPLEGAAARGVAAGPPCGRVRYCHCDLHSNGSLQSL